MDVIRLHQLLPQGMSRASPTKVFCSRKWVPFYFMLFKELNDLQSRRGGPHGDGSGRATRMSHPPSRARPRGRSARAVRDIESAGWPRYPVQIWLLGCQTSVPSARARLESKVRLQLIGLQVNIIAPKLLIPSLLFSDLQKHQQYANGHSID